MTATREYFHGLNIEGVAFSEITQALITTMQGQITNALKLVEAEIANKRNEIARATPILFPTDTRGLDWQALMWYSQMVNSAHDYYNELKEANEKIIVELQQAQNTLYGLAWKCHSPGYVLKNIQHDLSVLNKFPHFFAELNLLLDEIFDSTNRDIIATTATEEMEKLTTESDPISDKIYSALQVLVNSADYENINPIYLETVLVKLKKLANDLKNPDNDYQKTSHEFSNFVVSQKRSMIGQQLLFALKALAAALLTIATLGIKRHTANKLFNSGSANATLHRDIYNSLNMSHTGMKKRGRQ